MVSQREAKFHLHDVQTVSASQWNNMASKASPFSRSEIQEAIKTQGEIIRQLKLEEQTDEVKKKVKSYCFFSQPFSLTLKKFENVPVSYCRYHVASMKLLITSNSYH